MTTQNTGQSLWNRAKQLIPGGNMLLSKRPELFLPNKWPSYYSKASGCRVWDLDNQPYLDFAQMSVGACSLGYAHPDVDAAASFAIQSGNMTTLNCPEEVYLAERLIALHPWAEMSRFARSGGEANAIAIRIARASTGRDSVAICGYHGWHDWYLAANLQRESGLAEHLLPGLEPIGVPSGLAGSVHPFSYNRLDQLETIIANHRLAAVKMEVQRSVPPAPGFLEGIRKLCSTHGIVLIFDECTSGFRQSYGGLHKIHGVEPDLAMFGKALGNGFAISAIIGRESVMRAAQTTFISSTFWTERIGPIAALKTLDIMERESSWQMISNAGTKLSRGWVDIAKGHGVVIELNGISALPGFSFESPNHLKYKTLMTQEMLKKGYLATTSCYLSIAHTDKLISRYLEELDPVFQLIADCEADRESIDDLLESPVCHSGFTRLN